MFPQARAVGDYPGPVPVESHCWAVEYAQRVGSGEESDWCRPDVRYPTHGEATTAGQETAKRYGFAYFQVVPAEFSREEQGDIFDGFPEDFREG